MSKLAKPPILPRYPWSQWFRKTTFRLKQRVDFHCTLHGMASQIRNAASRRKLQVSVQLDEKAKSLTVTVRK